MWLCVTLSPETGYFRYPITMLSRECNEKNQRCDLRHMLLFSALTMLIRKVNLMFIVANERSTVSGDKNTSDSPQCAFFSITDLIDIGEKVDTQSILSSIEGTQNNPADIEIQKLIAESLLQISKGKYAEALTTANEALTQTADPGLEMQHVDVLLCKADALEYLGRRAESQAALSESLELLVGIGEERHKEIDARKAIIYLYEGVLLVDHGKHDEAMVKFEGSMQVAKKLGITKTVASAYNGLGNVEFRRGDLDAAQNHYLESLQLRKELGHNRTIAGSQNNLGLIYESRGDLNRALECFEECLLLNQKLGNERVVGFVSQNIGNIYLARGELSPAMQYYMRNLIISEQAGHLQDVADCRNNIALIHLSKGELDLALEELERSLAAREQHGNKQDLAASYQNIGSVYHSKGEYTLAQQYLTRALTIHEMFKNELNLAGIRFALLDLAIDMKETQKAQDHLRRIQEIEQKRDNLVLTQMTRLGQGQLLKNSKRSVQRAKAQEIFQSISDEEVLEYEFTVAAMLNLCELLFFELKSSGSEEALQEVKELLDRLLTLAKTQNSFRLLSETYLLLSRLALIELDIDLATSLLTQALTIAEEKGLVRLQVKIENQKEEFKKRIATWNEFIVRDKSLAERMELLELDAAINRMVKKGSKAEDAEGDEEGVMILILSGESGVSLFAEPFVTEQKVDEQLVGGFISAIDTFSRHTFAVSGSIERIKHRDYTLIMKQTDSLVFCYVFRGSSYSALQKLEAFMGQVRSSMQAWDALTVHAPRLSSEDENAIRECVGDIF